MEERDEIIVFGSFENSMEANLAKTKLDAYGIPCFLTDENLASLYPIQNPRFSVRLHIFQQDEEQVRLLLNEKVGLPDTICPMCGSAQIEAGYTKKAWPLVISLLLSVLFVLFPPKRVYHCLDCKHEF